MSKKYDRKKIGEIVQKISELNLSYVDGANEFGIPVRNIYRYNNESKRSTKASYADDAANDLTSNTSANHADQEENEKVTISYLPTEV